MLHNIKKHIYDPIYINSYYMMIDSIIGSILGFLFWITATHFYDTSEIGLTVALISASGIVVNISKLGLDNSVIRFLANEEDQKSFINTCLTIVSIISIFISMIFILGIDILAPKLIFVSNSLFSILILFLFNIIATSLIITGYVFIALRNTKYYLFQNFIFQSLKIPLPILFTAFAAYGILLSWCIAMTTAFLVSIIFLIRYIVPSYIPYPTISKKIINKIFHFSAGNYITSIIAGVSSSILPLMILHFLTPADSAYYYISFTIAGTLFIIPSAFSMSLYAESSFKEETFILNLKKVLKQTYFLLIPSVTFIIIFGDELLSLFGTDYSTSGQLLLSILAISSLFLPLNTFYNTYLRVQLRIRELFVITIVNVLLLIGAAYILLPILGLIGIGIAYIVAAALVSVYIILRISSQRRSLKSILNICR